MQTSKVEQHNVLELKTIEIMSTAFVTLSIEMAMYLIFMAV